MNLTEEDIITEHFGGAYEGFRSPIKVIPQIFLVFVLARSASHTAHVKSRWVVSVHIHYMRRCHVDVARISLAYCPGNLPLLTGIWACPARIVRAYFVSRNRARF